MSPDAPVRSLEQRMLALKNANEIRTRRAALKRDIRDGGTQIRDVILEPPDYALTARVYDLLVAAPKLGPVKARRALRDARVSPRKTLGGLSLRQRAELTGTLGSHVRVPGDYQRGTGNDPGTQHMRALAEANRARQRRSEVKRRIAEGEVTVVALLRDPPDAALEMQVGDLLDAQPYWGDFRVRSFLSRLGLDEAKTLGSMTTRQLRLLADRLDSSAEARDAA